MGSGFVGLLTIMAFIWALVLVWSNKQKELGHKFLWTLLFAIIPPVSIIYILVFYYNNKT